jgi:hypothetical protein
MDQFIVKVDRHFVGHVLVRADSVEHAERIIEQSSDHSLLLSGALSRDTYGNSQKAVPAFVVAPEDLTVNR